MYSFDRNEYERRMKWFLEARFGMFIHWGLYAIPARGEWAVSYTHLDVYKRQAPPRGERGLKHMSPWACPLCLVVAPPRGERGLKPLYIMSHAVTKSVAPPRGERGLKP